MVLGLVLFILRIQQPTGIPDQVDLGIMTISLDNWVEQFYTILFSVGVFSALLMLVVNAIKVMTSGHNPEAVQQGIAGIQNAILGLIVVIVAAGIVFWINNMVVIGG